MLRIIGCPSCKSQFAIPDPSKDPTFPQSDTIFVEELSLHCSHCDTVFLLGLNPFFEQTGEFISINELHTHGSSNHSASELETETPSTETHSAHDLDSLDTDSFEMDAREQTAQEDERNREIEEDIFEEEDWKEPVQESLFTFSEDLSNRDLSAEEAVSEDTHAIDEEELSFGEWESPAYHEDPELLITEEELWETPLSDTAPSEEVSGWEASLQAPVQVKPVQGKSEEDVFLDSESSSSDEYYYEEDPNLLEDTGYEQEEYEFLHTSDLFRDSDVNEKHLETSTSDEEVEFAQMGGDEDTMEANDSGAIDLDSMESEANNATIPEWEEIEDMASLSQHAETLEPADYIFEEQSLVDEESNSDAFDECITGAPEPLQGTKTFVDYDTEETFRSELQRTAPQDFAQVISIATPEASEPEEESGSEVRYEHAVYQSKTLSSHSATTLFTALIILILVGLGGFSVFLESDGPYQQRVKALISRDLPLPASHRITLDQVVLKKHVLTSGEEIFSIDAQLENGEDFSVTQIIGEGALYDSQGVLLMKRQLPLGKFLSLDQGVSGVEEAFSLQEQFSNRSTRVNAQERKKVRILFRANEVRNAHFFTMRPLATYR